MVTHNSDHSSSFNFRFAINATTVGYSHRVLISSFDPSSIADTSSSKESSSSIGPAVLAIKPGPEFDGGPCPCPVLLFGRLALARPPFSRVRTCQPLRTNTSPVPELTPPFNRLASDSSADNSGDRRKRRLAIWCAEA